MRPKLFAVLLVTVFLAMGGITVSSCVSYAVSPSTLLRNCVEQEASADGRLLCMKKVTSAGDEPKRCVERRTIGGKVVFQPIDDGRRDDLMNNARLLRYDAWNVLTNAPFEYNVDWGGAMVSAENKNAREWLRGSLLGADATLQLAMGPETRRLLELAIHPTGELIEDFVNESPAKMLGEVASDLKKVEDMLVAVRSNTHEYFSGLYMGLDKVNATTECYRDVAVAELNMQQAVTRFEKKVRESRARLDARHKDKSAQEADELKRDRETWSKAAPDTCRAIKKATDCDGMEAYLAAFPIGEHADEAQKILASVAGTLGSLRDEAAWSAAGVADCQSPKASAACDGVKTYVEKFPQGRHGDQARRMLRLRREALGQLAALEDQRRRIAKAQAQQACVQECVKTLRECQKQCKAGPPESLASCHKACLSAYNGTCVPGCKR